MLVLFIRCGQFKSNIYEPVRDYWRSRKQFAEKSVQQAEQIRKLKAHIEQLTNQSERDAEQLGKTLQAIEQVRRDSEELRKKPIR